MSVRYDLVEFYPRVGPDNNIGPYGTLDRVLQAGIDRLRGSDNMRYVVVLENNVPTHIIRRNDKNPSGIEISSYDRWNF